MAKENRYELQKDTKGLYWDLLLYVPTVIVLLLLTFQFWFSDNRNFSFILGFLTSFIFLIGFNRITKTRLMVLPSAPIAFFVSKQAVTLSLKNGSAIELTNNVRFFSDFAGKSIGLTGIDSAGKKQQFVFNKGQFRSDSEFNDAKASLRIFK